LEFIARLNRDYLRGGLFSRQVGASKAGYG